MNTGQNGRVQAARSANTEPPRSQEASVTSPSTPGWFSQASTFRRDKFKKKKKRKKLGESKLLEQKSERVYLQSSLVGQIKPSCEEIPQPGLLKIGLFPDFAGGKW